MGLWIRSWLLVVACGGLSGFQNGGQKEKKWFAWMMLSFSNHIQKDIRTHTSRMRFAWAATTQFNANFSYDRAKAIFSSSLVNSPIFFSSFIRLFFSAFCILILLLIFTFRPPPLFVAFTCASLSWPLLKAKRHGEEFRHAACWHFAATADSRVPLLVCI